MSLLCTALSQTSVFHYISISPGFSRSSKFHRNRFSLPFRVSTQVNQYIHSYGDDIRTELIYSYQTWMFYSMNGNSILADDIHCKIWRQIFLGTTRGSTIDHDPNCNTPIVRNWTWLVKNRRQCRISIYSAMSCVFWNGGLLSWSQDRSQEALSLKMCRTL